MARKNRKAIYVYLVLGCIFLDLGNKINPLYRNQDIPETEIVRIVPRGGVFTGADKPVRPGSPATKVNFKVVRYASFGLC